MEYATLGNTGLLVSKLCFGTMTFGDGRGLFKAISIVGQAGADELIKTSIDRGINFFDTADNYTEGESESILGQSLKNLNIARKDVVIATKVYSRVGPGRNDVGASRGHIMDGVEASLRRLQTDHIDLYQIHGNDSVTPVEETIRALDTLDLTKHVSAGEARMRLRGVGKPVLAGDRDMRLVSQYAPPGAAVRN
jgi:aryl-alcohol dehydrogenase-like predicted oxidoreductase